MLGEIAAGEMLLNDAGRMVGQVWCELPQRYSVVDIDTSVIMPNHFHGIIILNNDVGAPLAAPMYRDNKKTNQETDGPDAANGLGLAIRQGAASSAPTVQIRLGDVVRGFKSISAIAINKMIGRSGQPFWQHNYYERIIRNENKLRNIRQYIHDNPQKWDQDAENPTNPP